MEIGLPGKSGRLFQQPIRGSGEAEGYAFYGAVNTCNSTKEKVETFLLQHASAASNLTSQYDIMAGTFKRRMKNNLPLLRATHFNFERR